MLLHVFIPVSNIIGVLETSSFLYGSSESQREKIRNKRRQRERVGKTIRENRKREREEAYFPSANTPQPSRVRSAAPHQTQLSQKLARVKRDDTPYLLVANVTIAPVSGNTTSILENFCYILGREPAASSWLSACFMNTQTKRLLPISGRLIPQRPGKAI